MPGWPRGPQFGMGYGMQYPAAMVQVKSFFLFCNRDGNNEVNPVDNLIYYLLPVTSLFCSVLIEVTETLNAT